MRAVCVCVCVCVCAWVLYLDGGKQWITITCFDWHQFNWLKRARSGNNGARAAYFHYSEQVPARRHAAQAGRFWQNISSSEDGGGLAHLAR